MAGKPKPSWQALAVALALGGAGAGAGFLLGRGAVAWAPVRSSLEALSAWDLLALPLLVLAVIAVHELGHLAGGMSRGMRFLMFIAGPFGWVRGRDGVRFRWFFQLGTLGGVAAALPVASQPLRPQLTRLVVGGPLASLVLAALAAGVAVAADGRAGAYALIIAAFSTLIFVVTAVPMRAGGFMSDGMQLWQLRRNPALVERRARLLALMGQSLAGIRPRELDADLLAQAQALTGEEAMYDIGVWFYSYGHALDGGDVAAAGTWLERIAGAYEQYPDGFRQSLAIELALYEAVHRGRLPEAQDWLGRANGGVVDVSRRALAEAAVALRAGRRDAAVQALASAERRLGDSMDPGLARLSADQITFLRRSADAVPSLAA